MYLQKKVLPILIILTSAFPVLFIQLKEQEPTLNIYIILAKTGSLCGTVLIFWQFLLGYRQIIGKITTDLLWVFKLHKTIGKYILLLIVLHPIFITLYYLEKKSINPLFPSEYSPFYVYVLLGKIAIVLFFAVVVTSIFFRSRLGRTWWYGFHVLSYVALPLVMVHSLAIGMTIRNSAIGMVWRFLAVLIFLLFIFRIFCRLGIMSKKHKVSKVEAVGPNVTKITCQPAGAKVEPKLGQFVYFRQGFRGCIRPFTVSHYDKENGKISVTVKAKGKASQALQKIKPGETVYIEGPYGIFTHAALEGNRPIVMIAGGIGITPFVRLFEELAYEPDREVHLFYGNRHKNEIVYKEELENSEHIRTVHVLSQEEDYEMETGFIDINLIKKYVGALERYDFLICGPPPMIVKLESALKEAGLDEKQIHHELFGY